MGNDVLKKNFVLNVWQTKVVFRKYWKEFIVKLCFYLTSYLAFSLIECYYFGLHNICCGWNNNNSLDLLPLHEINNKISIIYFPNRPLDSALPALDKAKGFYNDLL